MLYEAGDYDIIVIGGGHAGCEAALASARLGNKTLMLTMSLDSIAALPCNPSIGGTGKGQLVREIDALGGSMGVAIDRTYIQSRMLNTAKGPAVHSLRAQTDKTLYHQEMKKIIEDEENLDVRMDEAVEILSEGNRVTGVGTKLNLQYNAKAIVIATGVYLNSKIYIGETNFHEGPNGLGYSKHLTSSLEKLGLKLRRFKTGTPARVNSDSINYSVMEVQEGDEKVTPFSFLNEDNEEFGKKEQIKCYLTRTTLATRDLINANLHRSAMYGGNINATGARYCPSIEDKIVKFADKPTHQLFIEPEGLNTKEMYIQGISTSLPFDVQVEMYRTITGLENANIMRPAYAIEYDCIDPINLKSNLEIKGIENLFSAGQFNGTSGYEEAAAQGIIAGINASRKINSQEPFVLDRSEGYIGVLIDDLVTKGTNEPYRMMTSRAEYRLYLRQDNADTRLTPKGYELGLVSEERYQRFLKKKELFDREMERLKSERVTPNEVNAGLEENGKSPIKSGLSLYEFLKRPEINYEYLESISRADETLPESVKMQCEIVIKYEGYIDKQMRQIEQFRKLENKKLREDLNYHEIDGLRIEARQKLDMIKPDSIGQASRISGVSPADISVLLIYLEQKRRGRRNENQTNN